MSSPNRSVDVHRNKNQLLKPSHFSPISLLHANLSWGYIQKYFRWRAMSGALSQSQGQTVRHNQWFGVSVTSSYRGKQCDITSGLEYLSFLHTGANRATLVSQMYMALKFAVVRWLTKNFYSVRLVYTCWYLSGEATCFLRLNIAHPHC